MAALVFILPLFVVIYILIQKYQIHKAFRDVVDKIPGPPAIFPLGNVLQFSFDKIGNYSLILTVRHINRVLKYERLVIIRKYATS